MKCNLQTIVQKLKAEFPLEICGNLDIQITDIRELTEVEQPSRPDVLYLTHQSRILNYHGDAARGPVLCISRSVWSLEHSKSDFPAMILVICQEPGQVYASLSRILYEEGSHTSEMSEISSTFLQCRSLDALVEAGYVYLGNPFAVHDSSGKLVTYSRQAGFHDEAWQSTAFLAQLGSFHSVDNAAGMDRSRQDQVPVRSTTDSGVPQLRMALSSRGQTLGYLTVMALFRPFSKTDPQTIQLLGCFVTLDLLRQHSITRTSTSAAGMLKAFLESGVVRTPELPRWLEGMRTEAEERYYLLLVNSVSGQHTPMLDVDALLETLDGLFPADICTRLEAGVVLLLKTTQSLGHHPGITALREALGQNLAVGVSMPFSDLADAGHGALRQARSAMELGTVLSPEKRIYSYESCAVYVGLRSAAGRMSLKELLPTGLLQLTDGAGSGELLHTLEVYLSTGGKKARTAELLFIHLNTLKYRLGQLESRLESRLEMDLDDPETLFSLEYSMRVMRYIRHFGDGT